MPVTKLRSTLVITIAKMSNRTLLAYVIVGTGLILIIANRLLSASLILATLLLVVSAGSAYLGLCTIKQLHHLAFRGALVGKANWRLQDLDRKPHVSILVPAKNEQSVIEGCVRNLINLNYPNLDVWVIDDNSNDRTLSLLKVLANEFPQLHIIERSHHSTPGKSAALNQALLWCRGEVIAVFDADAYVESEFLNQMIPELVGADIGAVQAQKRIFTCQNGLLVRCQSFEYATDTFLQTGRMLQEGAVELRGNGQLVKRSALDAVGGWNENAITDDLDLSTRMLIAGWQTRFVPDAVVYEEGVTTMSAWLRQRERWAEGSIRRYLDYSAQLLSCQTVPGKARADFIFWLIELVTPVLMITAAALQFLHGQGSCVIDLTLLFVSYSLAVGTMFVQILLGLKIYGCGLSWSGAFVRAVATVTYIFVCWSPCVVLSVVGILCQGRPARWLRTEHQGNLFSAPTDTQAALR